MNCGVIFVGVSGPKGKAPAEIFLKSLKVEALAQVFVVGHASSIGSRHGQGCDILRSAETRVITGDAHQAWQSNIMDTGKFATDLPLAKIHDQLCHLDRVVYRQSGNGNAQREFGRMIRGLGGPTRRPNI